MVDPSMILSTEHILKHPRIKRSCRRNRSPKPRRCTRSSFDKEVSEERKKLGKKVNDDDDDENKGSSGGGTVEKTVSKTDPELRNVCKGGT